MKSEQVENILDGLGITPNTNTEAFDYKLTKEEAEKVVAAKTGLIVMCKEYGDDEDWQEMTIEDIREDGKFDDDYLTFEIWD